MYVGWFLGSSLEHEQERVGVYVASGRQDRKWRWRPSRGRARSRPAEKTGMSVPSSCMADLRHGSSVVETVVSISVSCMSTVMSCTITAKAGKAQNQSSLGDAVRAYLPRLRRNDCHCGKY